MTGGAPALLSLREIRAGHGATPVVRDATLFLHPGDRLCLIGRNGAGKSTLLAVLDGRLEPEAGTRTLLPGVVVATLHQEPILPPGATLLDCVSADGIAPHRARALLRALGMDPARSALGLSGGQKRRVALARALATDAGVLLLDEPTNHLDLPAIEWLERELLAFRGAVLIISHDRAFLSRTSTGIAWLDRGRLRRLDSGFDAFEDWAAQVEQEEAAALNRLDQSIRAEERYMNYGVTARRRRNQRRLESLERMRVERRSRGRDGRQASVDAPDALQSGKMTLEADRISKSYDGVPVVRDVSLKILRGDRVGLIGPNGAGKTTLLKLLIGAAPPDSGRVRVAPGLQTAWFDQTRDSLNPSQTLWDAIGHGSDRIDVGGRTRHVVGYLKDFLFTEEQIRGQIAALSGGERNRLLLARTLMRPASLLVLDEPTNDLDMDTLDLLEDKLSEYEGTLLLVSHDRDFLDRLVTSLLALEGDGVVREYIGGYRDYLRVRDRDRDRATANPVSAATKSAPPRSASARAPRLGYGERRELTMLPQRIAALETAITAAEAALTALDPDRVGPDGFRAAAAHLAQLQADKAAAEERWLALEIRREAVEGGAEKI